MESISSPTPFRLSSSIVLIWPNKWENKRKEAAEHVIQAEVDKYMLNLRYTMGMKKLVADATEAVREKDLPKKLLYLQQSRIEWAMDVGVNESAEKRQKRGGATFCVILQVWHVRETRP